MITLLWGVTIVCSALALAVSALSVVFSRATVNYRAGRLDATSCRIFEAINSLSQPRRRRP